MLSFSWTIVIFLIILIEISSNFHGVRQNVQSIRRYSPTVTTWGITSGNSDRYRCHGQILMELAPRMKPRAQNVPGNLFVDEGTMMMRLVFEVPVRMIDTVFSLFTPLIRLH